MTTKPKPLTVWLLHDANGHPVVIKSRRGRIVVAFGEQRYARSQAILGQKVKPWVLKPGKEQP